MLLDFAKGYRDSCLTPVSKDEENEDGTTVATTVDNQANSTTPLLLLATFNTLLEDIETGSGFLCRELGEEQSDRFLKVGSCVNGASKLIATCTSEYQTQMAAIDEQQSFVADVEEKDAQICWYVCLFY